MGGKALGVGLGLGPRRHYMANGLIMNCCEQCGEYLPSKGAGNNVLVVDGQQKRFCCQSCVSEYKQVTPLV